MNLIDPTGLDVDDPGDPGDPGGDPSDPGGWGEDPGIPIAQGPAHTGSHTPFPVPGQGIDWLNWLFGPPDLGALSWGNGQSSPTLGDGSSSSCTSWLCEMWSFAVRIPGLAPAANGAAQAAKEAARQYGKQAPNSRPPLDETPNPTAPPPYQIPATGSPAPIGTVPGSTPDVPLSTPLWQRFIIAALKGLSDIHDNLGIPGGLIITTDPTCETPSGEIACKGKT
jgi:hypothetical protein